jgi:hypothetical protein
MSAKKIEIRRDGNKVKIFLNTLSDNDSVTVDGKEIKMKKTKAAK